MSYLTKQQKEAYDKFKKLKVGALFMEMGTGKTRIAIELINYNKVDLVLWFTPFSTKKNLQEEINKWNIKHEYTIFGWETLSQSDKSYLELMEKIKAKKIFIVCDESIFVKNQDTKRYKRLMNISKYSEYRLLLNGTPITKNEWDLYYQMNFLSPKIIGMSEGEFRATFYKHIIYKKRNKKANDFYKLSEVNIGYLHKLIDPYIIQADFNFEYKEQKMIKLIEPTNNTIDKYEAVKKHTLENIHEMNSEEVIKLLNWLNKISSTDVNKAFEIAEYSQNKKVIIFVNYLEELHEIAEQIGECYIIHGGVKEGERNMILKSFENDSIPLVMTIGTGSFGLNLQFCNEIVFSSINFDYSKMLQAKGRIRRIGQTQSINYTYFDCDLPINKFIKENIKKKEQLVDFLLGKLKENL